MPDPLKAAGHFFVQTSEDPLEPIIITTRDFGGKTPHPVSLEFRAFFLGAYHARSSTTFQTPQTGEKQYAKYIEYDT